MTENEKRLAGRMYDPMDEEIQEIQKRGIAVVGAGSVVTKDIPEGTVAVGNPAKVIKQV